MIPIRRLATATAMIALFGCKGEASRPENPPAAELPPGHPPIGAAEALPPSAEPASAGLAWTPPPGWRAEKPSSAMRRAQYRVPGPGGEAECVVFYFGPGQGGDAQSNAERWASQFTQPDGRPSESVMKTSNLTVGGLAVVLVEVTGTYAGGMGMGGPAASPQPDAMLLGAIVPGPDANWFFKLTGPAATVKTQRGAFEAMIRSVRKGTA
jgi:hypothetical protein